MKTRNFLSLILLSVVALTFTACQKDEVPPPSQVQNMKDLQVSPDFKWETARDIELNFSSSMPSASTLAKITVYDGNPADNGQIIASGAVGNGLNFTTLLKIPTRIAEIYAEYKDANGMVQLVNIPISGNKVNYTFTAALKYGNLKSSLVVEPDCSTDCDQTISGSGSYTINGGKTFCITDNFNGSISFESWDGGGTLKICGTASIPQLIVSGGNCKVIVTGSGSLTSTTLILENGGILEAYSNTLVNVGTLNLNTNNAKVMSYSNNFNINSNFAPNGLVENSGTMNVSGNYTNNGNGLINIGTLNIANNLESNKNINNSGKIEVDGNITFNSGEVVTNTCQIITHGNLTINGSTFTNNNAYIKVDHNFTLNSTSNLVLQDQSLLSIGQNFTANKGNTIGEGTLNSIKVAGNSVFNSNTTVSGAIEFADYDGTVTTSHTVFVNGATLVSWENITNYIPIGPCNPEGIGNPPITDTDGDGVPDEMDEYPTDPTRSFNTYYPNENTWGSLAFEDLWPSTGDYDFNDLVTYYHFTIVTNAQNKVVDIISKFHVKAIGAGFQNGFGFQIDGLTPNMVASVTGTHLENNYITLASNGLEANQEKAVVIAWDNAENVIHRVGGSMFNTVHNEQTGTADTVVVTLQLAQAQEVSVVGTPPFNPFLIRQMDRGHEIHLVDHFPTSLMYNTLLGTYEDASNSGEGKYFRTANNLPWGIDIPYSFDWMLEKEDILNGYNYFDDWAQSSGTEYTDWYLPNPGYRNEDVLY